MLNSLDTLAERVRTARISVWCDIHHGITQGHRCDSDDSKDIDDGLDALIAAAEALGAAKERQRVRRAVENALPEDLFNGWSLSYVVENILATIDALP